MDQESYSRAVELLTMALIGEKNVSYDGHVLFPSGHMALGTGPVDVLKIVVLDKAVIVINFVFKGSAGTRADHFTLPIIQRGIPNFDISSITYSEGKMVVLSSHITNANALNNKFAFSESLLPFNFSACRFIFDESIKME